MSNRTHEHENTPARIRPSREDRAQRAADRARTASVRRKQARREERALREELEEVLGNARTVEREARRMRR